MDTSDSECFESADEGLTDEEDVTWRETTSAGTNETNYVQRTAVSTKNNASSARPEFGVPPARATCWEPGMNNLESRPGREEDNVHPAARGLPVCTKINKDSGRPEFGIPPARTTCWMPEMQQKGRTTKEDQSTDDGGDETKKDNRKISEQEQKTKLEITEVETKMGQEENKLGRVKIAAEMGQTSEEEGAKDDQKISEQEPKTKLEITEVETKMGQEENKLRRVKIAAEVGQVSVLEEPERESKVKESANTSEVGQTEEKLGQNEENLGQNEENLGQNIENLGQNEENLGQNEEKVGQNEANLRQKEENLGQNEKNVEQQEIVPDKGDKIKSPTEKQMTADGSKTLESFKSKNADLESENVTTSENSQFENSNLSKSAANVKLIKSENENSTKSANVNTQSGNVNTKPGKVNIKSGKDIVKPELLSKFEEVDDVTKSSVTLGDGDDLWGDNDGWDIDDDEAELETCTRIETEKIDTPNTNESSKLHSPEEDMWNDDEDWGFETTENSTTDAPTEKELKNTQNINKSVVQQEEASWGAWGSWGISSVLSTAANLTQGLSNVLESGIGVPNPETLAFEHSEERKSNNEPESDAKLTFGLSNLTNLVSGVSTITKLVESTGTKVISGGLDTLETIGKKTMEVLSENDPGLKKKRAFLKIPNDDKPVLSQILREAKEKTEIENEQRERQHFSKKANYESIFDDYQGLVHLEALEMLSKQCSIKLESLTSKCVDNHALNEMQETIEQVKELCELPEDEDETLTLDEIRERISTAVDEIGIAVTYEKILGIWDDTETWLPNEPNANVIYRQSIDTLAQMTAACVEQYHKTGELLLVKDHRSTADEADSLVQLTTSLSFLINLASIKFSEKLNAQMTDSGRKEEIHGFITNIYVEANNSATYIKDAFELLIPVLQIGAT